jgi:hypothetical protein
LRRTAAPDYRVEIEKPTPQGEKAMKIAGRKWMYRSFDTLPESQSAFPIRF